MKRTRRTRLAVGGVVVALLATAGALSARRDVDPTVVTSAAVTRGPIVRTISATGTLEAVTTVAVGTQVSGSIQWLGADFNSIVKKGQVLARLDPALFESAIDQARANLIRAEADLDRVKVAEADAAAKLARARELSARQLIPAADLDAAIVALNSASAQVKSAEAAVTQARAALKQAEVNLAKTVITSPIDGIVIARNVDVGQTVAASLSAPTLFELAGGLEKMRVKANIDEADVGAVLSGQTVTFTVDAYPNDVFRGTVEQVRLNPVVEQNVVTYAAMIAAPNPELKLRPGLTANVAIEVARRDNVLRVPAAALRLRPSADVKRLLRAPEVEPEGTVVWRYEHGAMTPVPVAVGATDGVLTEVSGEGIAEGMQVVTRASAASEATGVTTTRSSSPLMTTGGPSGRR